MKINFGLIFSKKFRLRGIHSWLKKNIIITKTLPFIWGLILSKNIAEYGVVVILMDYFDTIWKGNMPKAAAVVNLQDGLSSIFFVVTHVLESYTGRFNVTLLCTASYVIGLLLFWISEDMSMYCGAVILIAFGRASQPSAFVRYQLMEKVGKSRGAELNLEDRNGEHDKENISELQNPENRNKDASRDEITQISSESQNRVEISGVVNSEDQNGEHGKENKEIVSELQNPENRNKDNSRDEKTEISLESQNRVENSREVNSEDQNGEDGKENKEIISELQNPENRNKDDSRYEITEISSEGQNGVENRNCSRENRDTTKSERQKRDDNKEKRVSSSEHENGGENREEKRVKLSGNLWVRSAAICGAIVGIFFPSDIETEWENPFKLAALFLGASYLLFYSGCFCYSFEEPPGSPLYKMFRVLVAALRKWKLKYPKYEGGYYWKNHKRNFHFKKKDKIRLKPQVPRLWRWLDKAAIKGVKPKEQEKSGEIYSVKEVREVKRLSALMHMSFTIWPFGLVVASANTFFVQQAVTLKSDFDINFLFIISSVSSFAANSLFKLKKLRERKPGITIVRIGAGMLCAVLCCVVAGVVELYRLRLTRNEAHGSRDRELSLSVAILIPQFLLFGLMEGLAEQGLESFYKGYLPESMEEFVEPLAKFVLGIGKLLTLPCLWIFKPWLKNSINTSHLDRYFLMLAFFNIVALLWFLYYSLKYAYKEPYPNDEEFGKVHEQESWEVDRKQLSFRSLRESSEQKASVYYRRIKSDLH
ncbi:hypothetical protein L6164_002226 [Bauhinia variegata]|uniref:Uncharacterized protein n=1 Tax=Bauhinia variegata TaxID=167791 RepID=A0ACB9PXQ4_BAUVA|nr:hypothetical protein L6164_002226 [Bauhinia variegata]